MAPAKYDERRPSRTGLHWILAVVMNEDQSRARKDNAPEHLSLLRRHTLNIIKRNKDEARAPYEFGCKVSIATPVAVPEGGQSVLHAQALHGNPYDGHTLAPVIAGMEKLTRVAVRRAHVDKGYRGHGYDSFKV